MGYEFDFKESLEIGLNAKREVTKWLRMWNDIDKVQNMADLPEFQKRVIDTFITLKNGKVLSLTIKCDTNSRSGNLYFETISNDRKGTLGCYLQTEADMVVYYFASIKMLYMIPTKLLKEWLKRNEGKYREIVVPNQVKGKLAYNSKGMLVPKKVLTNDIPQIRVFDLSTVLEERGEYHG